MSDLVPRRGRLGMSAALALACAAAPDTPDAHIAAVVHGKPITVAEVDERLKADLLAERTAGDPTALLALRRRTLERMIEGRLIEAEAARRGEAPSAVAESAASAPGGVSDDEVLAFWNEHRARLGDHPFEQIAPQIRRFLERKRSGDAPTRPRKRAGVSIHLTTPRFRVGTEGPARGPEDARVTIVEFADFQCSHCRRSLATLERVLERYPRDVRLVYRHLPVETLHPRARAAAEAAACADAQDAFWPYHDRLFAAPESLGRENLVRHASDLGLDVSSFRRCVEEGRTRRVVDADLAAARALGLEGTPAFLVNGVLLAGARPAEEFYRLIDAELAAPAP